MRQILFEVLATFGLPVTDEYETDPGYVARQDFVLGWLNYNSIGSIVAVHTYSKYAPGWTASGWNQTVSYQLAALYETGGARNHYGEATDVAYLDGDRKVIHFPNLSPMLHFPLITQYVFSRT